MMWGLVRIGIFTTAFAAGLMFGGPGSRATSASSTLLACDEGRVLVIPLKGGTHSVIQLHCVGGKLVIARNRADGMEIIPNKRPIRYLLRVSLRR